MAFPNSVAGRSNVPLPRFQQTGRSSQARSTCRQGQPKQKENIMTINLSVPQTMQELRPRITVVGVGGAGV